jgi:chromate reductase
MHVTIISASPRAESLTLRFSAYLQNLLHEMVPGIASDLVDFNDFDFPVTGKGNLNPGALSPFQNRLIEAWKRADLVILASPEYNWTANAELFILFDRLGNREFRYLFEEKVFASAGVSSGRGGRQPALDINRVLGKVISFMGAFSVVSARIIEAHETGKNLSPEGIPAGNPVFESAARDFLRYNLEIARRWKASVPRLAENHS